MPGRRGTSSMPGLSPSRSVHGSARSRRAQAWTFVSNGGSCVSLAYAQTGDDAATRSSFRFASSMRSRRCFLSRPLCHRCESKMVSSHHSESGTRLVDQSPFEERAVRRADKRPRPATFCRDAARSSLDFVSLEGARGPRGASCMGERQYGTRYCHLRGINRQLFWASGAASSL